MMFMPAEKEWKKLQPSRKGAATRLISIPSAYLVSQIGEENIREDLYGKFLIVDGKLHLQIKVGKSA